MANGRLSFTAPDDATPAFDEYVSDPARPVPFSAEVTTTEGHLFMVEDQRFAATRPDVLVYESDVLTDDLTVAGDIEAHLAVSTTGTDGDWVAKLIDVYPGDAPDPVAEPATSQDGRIPDAAGRRYPAREVQEQPCRSRSRSCPASVTPLAFSIGDKYHTFKKGHRVMVQIQSSWFPMFDRNPQRFVDIYHAKDADYQRATHPRLSVAAAAVLPVASGAHGRRHPIRALDSDWRRCACYAFAAAETPQLCRASPRVDVPIEHAIERVGRRQRVGVNANESASAVRCRDRLGRLGNGAVAIPDLDAERSRRALGGFRAVRTACSAARLISSRTRSAHRSSTARPLIARLTATPMAPVATS